jgi:hypothetical protein
LEEKKKKHGITEKNNLLSAENMRKVKLGARISALIREKINNYFFMFIRDILGDDL